MQSGRRRFQQRFLSPSFKKGVIKDTNFNIHLSGDEEEKEDEKEDEKKEDIKKDDNKIHTTAIKKRSNRLSINEQNYSLSEIKNKENTYLNKLNPEEIIKITIKNLSYESVAGKGEDGFTKVNQDSYLILPNLYNINDFNIFSVMDGHGMYGHIISQTCVKFFTNFFKTNRRLNNLTTENQIYYALTKNNYEIIKNCYDRANSKINNSEIDSNLSGTTCLMLFQIGKKLIISNVGDSRGIIIKNNEVIPLSIDQKPNNENEEKRILKHGGEIRQFEENGIKSGPFRVWKKGENYPGIAMSRSIGDLISSDLGIISEPEIIEMNIDNNTKFIILASDGIWEFLSNENVKDIVMPFYQNNDPNGACQSLIKESTKLWESEDIVVDDITIIVLFF